MINILLLEGVHKSYLAEEELLGHKLISVSTSDIALGSKTDESIDSFLDNNFKTIINSQLIIIDNPDSEIGFRLVHHLRFGYLRIPIFVVCELTEEEIFKRYKYLSTKGTKTLMKEELSLALSDVNSIIDLEKDLKDLYKDEDSIKAGFLDKLIFKEPEQQGRHSIANQWGAYRFAEVGGLKIEDLFPKTLYFKYLKEISRHKNFSKHIKSVDIQFPIVKTILLIDDNCDKGWAACLKAIFGSEKVKSYESWKDASLDGAKSKIEKDEYDLIFLDYYFDEGDNLDKIGKGKEILKKIKGTKDEAGNTILGLNPVVPVIMFTASNKAWNMDEIYEAGADGYYVKEHPETAHDAKFSIENFEGFHKTVKHCLEKGVLLRKYWRRIECIKKSNFISDNADEKNKDRINERLVMFLGLLKKAFEQTIFDKNAFFYSEWELAFLTLWSALNEIQETYYVKEHFVFTDKFGNVIDSHTRRFGASKPSMPKISEWSLVLPNNLTPRYSKFIEYDFWFKYDLNDNILDNSGYFDYYLKNKSVLFYDGQSKQKRYYTFNNRGVTSVNVQLENILHSQIAFILLNMNAKSPLLENLKELNEKRNHLYLTHGEDSKDEDFSKLYQEQRKDVNLEENIEQLFEIVYFLSTGEECDWNN